MMRSRILIIVSAVLIFAMIIFLSSCSEIVPSQGQSQEMVEKKEVEIEILEGMTLTDIAELLEEEDIIDSAFTFRLFVQQEGKEKNLLPGKYRIMTGSEYDEVLEKITTAAQIETYKIVIPEGFTVKQIVERVVESAPFISIADMQQAVDISTYSYPFLEGVGSLEGFLFPKTYEITVDFDAKTIVEMMLSQYQLETGSLDYSFPEENGYSNYDVLKIASLIEREAYIPEERGLISAVIYNRLERGMTLGIDATIRYGLEKWDEPLTVSDLETDSPYNTRIYSGLTPTPICNPGLAAIEAALKPADEEYLYFVVIDEETHEHGFSYTLEEHEQLQQNIN